MNFELRLYLYVKYYGFNLRMIYPHIGLVQGFQLIPCYSSNHLRTNCLYACAKSTLEAPDV